MTEAEGSSSAHKPAIAAISKPQEPHRNSPGGALSKKMSTLARSDTAPEMALRRALHRHGMRYRVQLPTPTNRRRKIDVAFTRAKVAVFVDGCFWHGCPAHGTRPASNPEWWDWKIKRNRDRDADTNLMLKEVDWEVVRVWEHADPEAAAATIKRIVDERRSTG